MLHRPCSRLASALSLGSYRAQPKYLQQANSERKFMDREELSEPLRAQRRIQERRRNPNFRQTTLALATLHESEQQGHQPQLTSSTAVDVDAMVVVPAAVTSLAEVVDVDDDIVCEPFSSDVTSSHSSTFPEQKSHPSGAGASLYSKQPHRIGPDVLELVTDEFQKERAAEVKRRREFLYRLTHPVPEDYTYNGKLVPPPPLAFGQVTPESIQLGKQLMIDQNYSLVRSAQSSDYFFEINDVYMEIAMVGKANAGKSSLINALLQQNVAKTSSTPNSTREVSFYQSVTPEQLSAYANRNPNKLVKLPGGGLQLTFVDLPGYGIEGMSDKWRDNAIACTDGYLGTRRSVNTLLFCVDCEQGLTASDVTYLEWLENLHGVFWIILTKCDSVSHTRVCAVMKQVYTLITQYRRKFRKAFPFVLPVSAATGENMDVLRGLITETSGLIAGDKLRSMLHEKAKKQAEITAEAANDELRELWNEQKRIAREGFRKLVMQGKLLGGRTGRRGRGEGAQKHVETMLAASERSGGDRASGPVTAIGGGPSSLPTTKTSITLPVSSSSRASAGGAQGRGRRTEPMQRMQLGYGGTRFKLNDGVVVDDITVEFDTKPDVDADYDAGSRSTTNSSTTPRSVEQSQNHVPQIGEAESGDVTQRDAIEVSTGKAPTSGSGGRVSKYLDALDAMAKAPATPHRRATRDHERHHRRAGTSVFMAETADGRVAEFVAGKQIGKLTSRDPARSSTDKFLNAAAEQAQWKARRYVDIASKESPTAPWAALSTLQKKKDGLEQRAALSKMSKKDLESYLASKGRIISGFERFENEINTTRFMNETRHAKTLRQKAQWDMNSNDKINYRSQPPGLLKSYGQEETYWPTSSILGLHK